MTTPQSGILDPVPSHCRYMEFTLAPGGDALPVLRTLSLAKHPPQMVVGFGYDLVKKMDQSIDGLRPFPALSAPDCTIPSTQADLWCAISGNEPGSIAQLSRAFQSQLSPSFQRARLTDGFKYREGRDLSGYIDGTENPEGDDATNAALLNHQNTELDGSSYVAIQKWVHDLNRFESFTQLERDHIIGRQISDNEELDDAPISAHVKRTAQESFSPEAFLVRRSLPWSDASGEGLMFVAYGNSFDAFEAQLNRMIGLEDGILDGLFQFSRPITGGYYWCPPVIDGKLCLQAIGL